VQQASWADEENAKRGKQRAEKRLAQANRELAEMRIQVRETESLRESLKKE